MKYILVCLFCVISVSNIQPDEAVQYAHYNYSEYMCLSNNIYHEARGESFSGKVAVGLVTINRVRQSNYENTICSVVHMKKVKCQFSWRCDKKKRKQYNDSDEIFYIADMLLTKKVIDFTDGSLYYHTKRVRPIWRKSLQKTIVNGNHIFYR